MSEPRRRVAERFVLTAKAGRGSFGEVWQAFDEKTGQTVAVKFLRVQDEEARSTGRFDREAKVLASIRNPYVVRYIASGHDDDGTPFLALEWLDGEELSAAIKRGEYPLSQRLKFALEVATGLSALHAMQIVHRDVKPSNVVLVHAQSGSVVAKVVDLGIARVETDTTLTLDGHIIGTPAYMSPEQARSESEITPRADVFSLGVMLYELIAGQRPFRGRDIVTTLAKIVFEEPPDLRGFVPDLSEGLVEIVRCALRKNPAQRFADAGALASALRSVVGEELVTTEDTTEENLELEPPTLRRLPAVGGTVRAVTLVIAELAGSRKDIASSRASCEQAVRRHGGEFHPLLSGPVVAAFGLARAAGDEAIRACYAAIALRDVPGVRKVGVVTGLVTAQDGTMPGDFIDRAGGFLSGADAGVLIDDGTSRLVGERFVLEKNAHGAKLVRPAADHDAPTIAGRRTTTVGRTRELQALERYLRHVEVDRVPLTVVIDSAPGSGKSRLRHEFLDRVSARREIDVPNVWVARGDPMFERAAFGLVAQLVRSAVGLADNASPESCRSALLHGAQTLADPSRALRTAVFLGEIVGAQFPDDAQPSLSAARRNTHLAGDLVRQAFIDFVEAWSIQRTLVTVVEDLQWADRASIDALDAARRAIKRGGWLLLGTTRPEGLASLEAAWRSPGFERLHVGDLDRESASLLVQQVLGDQVNDERLRQLVDQSGGNPFYLEELLRLVIDGRGTALPETILALAQSRLDALPGDARSVVRAASVFGRVAWLEAVRAVCADVENVDAAFEDLVRREVIALRPSSAFLETTEFAFRQAAMRDAAYESIVPEARKHYHARAAEWLSTVGERDAALLAEHFERAGDDARAAVWNLRAARHALDGGEAATAIARAERAAVTGIRGRLLGTAKWIQADALYRLGDVHGSAERAVEAMGELDRGSVEWFAASGLASRVGGGSTESARVDRVAREVLAAPVSDATRSAFAEAAARVLASMDLGGDSAAASAFAAAVEARLGSAPLSDPTIAGPMYAWRARIARVRDETETYVDAWHACAEAYLRVGDERSACVPLVNEGNGQLELGEYAAAERTLARAVALARRIRNPTAFIQALENYGLALACIGRYDEAIDVESRAVAFATDHNDARIGAGAQIYLAMTHLARGDERSAESSATQAIALSSAFPPMRATALALRADAHRRAGRIAEAFVDACEAEQVILRIGGSFEYEFIVRLAIAEAAAANGDAERARRTLADARGRLRARGRGIRTPARRATFEAIEANRRIATMAAEFLGPTV